jgi:predicted PurR-regulated permease PerM
MENQSESTGIYVNRSIEIVIRIGLLIFIFGWCFLILSPFLTPVMWGMIIAVTVYPFYNSLTARLRGRSKLAAILITLFFVSLLLIPAWLLTESLIDGLTQLKALYESGVVIPPPGERVKSWPAIAKPLVDLWQLASENLQAVAQKFAPQLKAAGAFVLSLLSGIGIGVGQFLLSIILAGVFLGFSKESGSAIRRIFVRLAGEQQGGTFAQVTELTIRNVVKGVLGVAVGQTLLAAIGFFAAGVPGAGLWTILCLILALIQVGVAPVSIGVIIYMWVTADTLTAALLTGWLGFVSISDNILKPLLLGKGAPVPMLVVLLGSLGGFVVSGFLGLFLGPVLLAMGYTLFQTWLGVAKVESQSS